jgi:hypothetical protein
MTLYGYIPAKYAYAKNSTQVPDINTSLLSSHGICKSPPGPLLAPARAGCQPPRPERQTLQLRGSRLDEHEERDCADDHAQHVGDIVAVAADLAHAAAVDAAVLLGLEGTGEGRGDEGVFEGVGGRGDGRWNAGGLGEEVDQLEDEEPGEGTAQI